MKNTEKKVCRDFGSHTFRGQSISPYGVQNGRVDYGALASALDGIILNNRIHSATDFDAWELYNGQDYTEDDGGDVEYIDVYQEYIISQSDAEFLREWTDEIIYFNEDLDIYLWAVTHYGTSWSYVLTDIEIIDCTKPVADDASELPF